MKKRLAILFLAAAGAAGAQTPTPPPLDDLGQALVAHGMDPTLAGFFATGIETALVQAKLQASALAAVQQLAASTAASAADAQNRIGLAEANINSLTATTGSQGATLSAVQTQLGQQSTQIVATQTLAQGAINQVSQNETNVAALTSQVAALQATVAALQPPPPPPPVTASPITIEAETATGIPSSNVVTSTTASGGKYVGNILAGQIFSYTVAIPAAGNYALSAAVASPVATAAFHFTINGVASPSIAVPNTGSYTTWKPVTGPTASFAGPANVTIQIVVDKTQFNVDSFTLIPQ